MKITVVAGNPKPESRTLDAARVLATALTGEPGNTVDVITLGAGLLGWGDAAVAAAVESVASSDLVVFASPTFKATYTGVLKLFLDQFAGGTGLQDVVAVPLMLGAGPAHAMAPDLFLKHVLVELGAVTPAPGLYLIDSTYTTDSRITDYVTRWGDALLAAARTRTEAS
ncbi:NAD(P)H-dependent oxidoreductase [Rhodococcoides yunnanense]|uniref:NAD(P)H-dependent oxidoreductase n=1 Tax=Rhodococcoides yunnanense TaxID=278209 RepID=A0ABU4BHU7_9NOCA|nr:NAD(P)H-dependent oxidoreductase [Rhodococcus yunnanensis]MDV6263803.1 NAD(P)H-dependent oxidoreductase [Rhodococcus yunnanensis]